MLHVVIDVAHLHPSPMVPRYVSIHSTYFISDVNTEYSSRLHSFNVMLHFCFYVDLFRVSAYIDHLSSHTLLNPGEPPNYNNHAKTDI